MPKYYTKKELLLRIVWSMMAPVFFRLSPRLLYSWRNFLLRMFGATLGKGVKIYPSAVIEFPWLLEVGDYSVIAWNVRIYNLGKIIIGSRTVISQHAHLCGGTHDYLSTDFTLVRTGLTIGSNVWIAADAFISPGVVVHEGAIVGARAVVTRDVDGKSVVAGNPAVEIKKLANVPLMQFDAKPK